MSESLDRGPASASHARPPSVLAPRRFTLPTAVTQKNLVPNVPSMTTGRISAHDMPPATGGGDGLPGEDAALNVNNETPVHATKTNGMRDDDTLAADQKHAPKKTPLDLSQSVLQVQRQRHLCTPHLHPARTPSAPHPYAILSVHRFFYPG